jgi:hypothetical protein
MAMTDAKGAEKKMVAKTNHLRALAAAAGMLVAGGLLVLMMLVVEARPAEATFPGPNGKNGKIVYEQNQNQGPGQVGKNDIYTQDCSYPSYTPCSKGGREPIISNRTARDNDPVWSPVGVFAGTPNGQRIAFASTRDGSDLEIYTAAPDGTKIDQLTNNLVNDEAPTWSPDGKRSPSRATGTPPATISTR